MSVLGIPISSNGRSCDNNLNKSDVTPPPDHIKLRSLILRFKNVVVVARTKGVLP